MYYVSSTYCVAGYIATSADVGVISGEELIKLIEAVDAKLNLKINKARYGKCLKMNNYIDKSIFGRVLSIVLSITLLFGLMPLSAFANNGNNIAISSDGVGFLNTISGMIWIEDTSGSPYGDGLYDAETEERIEGFSLNLYKADDTSTVITTAETDFNGQYTFSNIEDGDYIVGFTAQTINNVEYLMPLSGITGNNKFAIDSTWTQVLTETITVSNGTNVRIIAQAYELRQALCLCQLAIIMSTIVPMYI